MPLDEIDCSALPDLRQNVLKTGYDNLAEALGRRLITPRGGLFYDSDYGYDLRQHINQENTGALLVEIARNVEEECEKDDRVESAEATITVYDLRSMKIAVSCITIEDTIPYEIAVSVDNVTVAASEAQAASPEAQAAWRRGWVHPGRIR